MNGSSFLFCLLSFGFFNYLASNGLSQNEPAPVPESLVRVDDKGRLVAQPHPVRPEEVNPIHSEEWLEDYRRRADLVLRTSLTQGFGFNTYFENEKYTLGQAMARTLAGDTGPGRTALSAKDVQADDWHKHTAGIDYYACFTIKHQMRKYFHFGPLLPPEYLAQMKGGT